ncbi:MAG: ribonuclease J [Alphaproteobacteria bacterium]|nr:ribonuclease J [Alphaproteobacteria bacterium]
MTRPAKKKGKEKNTFNLDEKALYFIPLGGSEQFGVNLNVYANRGEMLAIDCGIGFADERFPGIDLLLPDPAFLEENRDSLKAFIITHAHEDHIGAIAHIWDRLPVPVYASPFTAAILHEKFKEKNLRGVPIHTVNPGETVQIGTFSVEFVAVSHSVPDTCSLIIETPEGRIVHSGDWNLDPHPVVGAATNAKAFKDAGDKGVLAYIGDSTNAEVPGRSGSETEVERGLESVFRGCEGRIAITAFSSNIGRVRSIVKAAEACGREVGVIGRSLHRMIGCAIECGFLKGLPDFVDEKDLMALPADKVVIILTGSQGEYRAALSKIARGDFRGVRLNRGDTVIYSARAIPGNEKNINVVKNNLSASGINIITPGDTEQTIHVSGHPCREEITEMLQWVRPALIVPVHGERLQLEAHAALALDCQVPQALVPSNGSVIRLAPGTPEIVGRVPTDVLAVDQKRLIKSDHQSIVARRKLQFTGTVHISLVIDAKGELLADPRLETVGIIDPEDPAETEIEDNIHDEILDLLDELDKKELQDDHFITEEIRIGIRRFCDHLLGMKPHVSVHVLRV